jgi:hypothetical protein
MAPSKPSSVSHACCPLLAVSGGQKLTASAAVTPPRLTLTSQ